MAEITADLLVLRPVKPVPVEKRLDIPVTRLARSARQEPVEERLDHSAHVRPCTACGGDCVELSAPRGG